MAEKNRVKFASPRKGVWPEERGLTLWPAPLPAQAILEAGYRNPVVVLVGAAGSHEG
jgi:hypothetical protein